MGVDRRLVSTLLRRWLAAKIVNGNHNSKVGQKIVQSAVESDNEELNMGLMFTNKALQIMTPSYMLMKTTAPLTSAIPQE